MTTHMRRQLSSSIMASSNSMWCLIFQRLMLGVLDGVNPKDGQGFADVYIDNIPVFSQTTDDHVEHLRVVLDRLHRAGLKLKPKKCHFVHQPIWVVSSCPRGCSLTLTEPKQSETFQFPLVSLECISSWDSHSIIAASSETLLR